MIEFTRVFKWLHRPARTGRERGTLLHKLYKYDGVRCVRRVFVCQFWLWSSSHDAKTARSVRLPGDPLKKPIVIFGVGEIAELADFYFSHDSDYDVVAFTVDEAYLKNKEFRGRPVVAFERVTESFPPERCRCFVAVSYARLNALRSEKVAAARAKGYRLASYVSSRATAFPGFELKENCFILEDNTIQPFARIGANVTLWSGNHIGHHSTIEDDVFIASHAVVSGGVKIGQGSFIGVNVTLRDHVMIGKQCVLGAGALVLEDQPDFAVVAPRGTERATIPSTRLRKL